MEPGQVDSKDALVAFVGDLRHEMSSSPHLVESETPDDFLESLAGWLEDKPLDTVTWALIAKMLWAGAYYE